mmetsp:Transcript_62870/g.161843  ORF Transcript_62870/g.161843 Transcript_62870/m.161843 type:complete len:273 (+) Transcript_62870:315-1133(+)
MRSHEVREASIQHLLAVQGHLLGGRRRLLEAGDVGIAEVAAVDRADCRHIAKDALAHDDRPQVLGRRTTKAAVDGLWRLKGRGVHSSLWQRCIGFAQSHLQVRPRDPSAVLHADVVQEPNLREAELAVEPMRARVVLLGRRHRHHLPDALRPQALQDRPQQHRAHAAAVELRGQVDGLLSSISIGGPLGEGLPIGVPHHGATFAISCDEVREASGEHLLAPLLHLLGSGRHLLEGGHGHDVATVDVLNGCHIICSALADHHRHDNGKNSNDR